MRPVKALDPQIIQKICAGRISVALSVENTIFLWDCLKSHTFIKMNLNFMGLQNVSDLSLSNEESTLALSHKNTRHIDVLSFI
jgi:hypothetical protein